MRKLHGLVAPLLVLLGVLLVAPSTPGAPTVPEIRVTATEFKFAPNKITFKLGQPVKLTLVNRGTVEHDLHSDALDLGVPAGMGEMAGMEHETLRPGKSASVTFTAKKKGTFAFWCTVPGHQDAGMKGTIIVQ